MPAISLLPGEVARYIHASVNEFQAAAVRDATRLLGQRTIADPATWSLNYDTACESFMLACHNADGFELNEQLQDVLAQLVGAERKAVVSIDHKPLIAPAEKYYAFEDMEDIDDETSSDDAFAARSYTASRTNDIFHVISTDGLHQYGKLKAIRTSGLPLGLQIRSRNQSQLHNVGERLSFRLVRWDDKTQEHVFNARIGEALPPMIHDEALSYDCILGIAFFERIKPSMSIRRQLPSANDVANETAPMDWDFVGERPSVQQWLVGMGKTRRVDYLPPDTAPEASRDAVKFTGGASQYPVAGRLRVPKGVPLSALLEEDESQAQEKTEKQLDNDFAQLMRSKAMSDDDSSDEDDQSSRSNDSESVRPRNFAALMKDVNHTEPTAPHQDSAMTKRPSMTVVSPPKPQPSSYPQALTDETTSEPASSTHDTTLSDNCLPTFPRRYAKVDEIGLAGDAANQALWEHENNHPAGSVASMRTSKTRKQIMRARQATGRGTASGSAAMFVSDGRDLHIGGRPGDAVSTTPMSYGDTKLGGDESWAHNVVPQLPSSISGHLVDVNENNEHSRAPILTPDTFPLLASQPRQKSTAPSFIVKSPPKNGSPSADRMIMTPPSYQRSAVERSAGANGQFVSPKSKQPAVEVLVQVGKRSSPPKPIKRSGYPGSEPLTNTGQSVLLSTPAMGNLVDVDTDASSSWPALGDARPAEKLSSRMPTKYKILNLTAPVPTSTGPEDSDRVVERLRPAFKDDVPKLYRTMRQKAQKKGKKKSAGKCKTKWQPSKTQAKLELPDAPPPAKARNESTNIATTKHQSPDAGSKAVAIDGPSERTVLHQRLSQTTLASTSNKPTLMVRFGMIFMSENKELATSKAARVPDLQAVLDDMTSTTAGNATESVQFMPVLTQAAVDATYLLLTPKRLAPVVFAHQEVLSLEFLDDVQIVYEIEIVDYEHNLWTILVDQNDFDTPIIKMNAYSNPSIYVHCPMSVWDARVEITDGAATGDTASEVLVEAIRTFLKTFDGPGKSPGFEADIPEIDGRPAFSVNRILGKRLYTQRLPLDLTTAVADADLDPTTAPPHAVWHVDQLWDLHISYGDGRKGEPSITAYSTAEDNMKTEGRLWFEASLHLDEGLNYVDVEESGEVGAEKTLQELGHVVNKIVNGLDCVGLGGLREMDPAELMRVPQLQQKKIMKRRKSKKEPDYVPFW